MLPIIPLKTNLQHHQGSAAYKIRVCLGGCEPAQLGVAIELGLVSHFSRNCWISRSLSAYSGILLCKNPKKLYVNDGVLPCKKIGTTFFSSSAAAPMRNELREGPAKADLT